MFQRSAKTPTGTGSWFVPFIHVGNRYHTIERGDNNGPFSVEGREDHTGAVAAAMAASLVIYYRDLIFGKMTL